MDKKQEEVSRKLEPQQWRTTARENRKDYERQASVGKWANIIDMIVNYQNKNNGMSPSDATIARECWMNIGTVRYHLREMEKAGLIKDRKGWPRHISVETMAKPHTEAQPAPAKEEKVTEAKVRDSADLRKGGQKRAFIIRAKQIAQAVIDHYDQHGTPPRGSWVAEKVYGVANASKISNVVSKMVELGWLYHRPGYQNDMAVTGLGRAALFGEVSETLRTNTPVNPTPKPDPIDEEDGEVPVITPLQRFVTRGRIAQAAASFPAEATVVNHGPVQVSGLENYDDVDLVIELTKRGFKVTR